MNPAFGSLCISRIHRTWSVVIVIINSQTDQPVILSNDRYLGASTKKETFWEPTCMCIMQNSKQGPQKKTPSPFLKSTDKFNPYRWIQTTM